VSQRVCGPNDRGQGGGVSRCRSNLMKKRGKRDMHRGDGGGKKTKSKKHSKEGQGRAVVQRPMKRIRGWTLKKKRIKKGGLRETRVKSS